MGVGTSRDAITEWLREAPRVVSHGDGPSAVPAADRSVMRVSCSVRPDCHQDQPDDHHAVDEATERVARATPAPVRTIPVAKSG